MSPAAPSANRSASRSSASSRRWWALGAIATAQFMVIMDTSIIGVALPMMQTDLGFAPQDLSWVFNGYVVAFGGLLLLIAPSALTLLMVLFAGNGKELTKALALYGAAAPAGGTAGVFLGGVLTQYASWPWVFYLNVHIALAVIVIATRLMPHVPGSRGSNDWSGAATVTGGLAALVYGIVRAPEVGWGSTQTMTVGAGAVALLGVFMLLQARRRAPLVRLGLFRTPALGAANVAQFLLGAAWVPMWFFLNLYLQQVLGLTAFPSGSALLPMTVLIMAGMVLVAPRAIAQFGPKRVLVTGMSALAAGLGLLWLIRADGSYVVDVLPATLVAAAGIVNTSYQIGSALGLAAMTAFAAASGADQLGDVNALTDGYSAAFVGAAVVAAAGAVLAAITLRLPKPERETAAADAEAVAV